ncbi:hypothetical protein PFISCL1PPCAC_4917, partial [Pristionchus fissidentatus]
MTKDVRRGLLTFLLNPDADDFAPLVAYSNSTSPEETTALKVTEDAYQISRFYTIRCSRKRLLLLSIVFLSLLVFSSILTAVIFNNTLLNTCTSQSCITASEALRRNSESQAAIEERMRGGEIVDDRPAPCEDFFEYACAGWKENTVGRAKNNPEWNMIYETTFRTFDRISQVFTRIVADPEAAALTTAQRDAVITYQKCMSDSVEDAGVGFRKIYKDVGGWITTASNEISIEDTLVASYRMNSVSLFSLSAVLNVRENRHSILTIEEAVPILGNSKPYSSPIEYDVNQLLAGKSANPYVSVL